MNYLDDLLPSLKGQTNINKEMSLFTNKNLQNRDSENFDLLSPHSLILSHLELEEKCFNSNPKNNL